MGPKSATEKQLIDLGVPNPHAKLLSYGRRLEDVQAMDTGAIATVLCIPQEKAEEIHHVVQGTCPSLTVHSEFDEIYSRLLISALDHISNLSGDSRRFDAAALWFKHSGQPAPATFDDFSDDDEETAARVLHLLELEFGMSPSFAASLVFLLDGTDIVVTGIQFSPDTLSSVATDLAELGYIENKDAKFLGRNADLISPNVARDLRVGDTVAHFGSRLRTKTSKYRPRGCGSKGSNPGKEYTWPAGRWSQFGRITYVYHWENIYDVKFDDGASITIHNSHLARVIAVGRNGTWTL